MAKLVVSVDEDVDLESDVDLWWAMVTRLQADRDLTVLRPQQLVGPDDHRPRDAQLLGRLARGGQRVAGAQSARAHERGDLIAHLLPQRRTARPVQSDQQFAGSHSVPPAPHRLRGVPGATLVTAPPRPLNRSRPSPVRPLRSDSAADARG
jgi:hypothetical protein